ncbi:hypothetical protein 10S2_4 [uncultured Caudovirales phage]|uniref:Uncharacterized protein n=1 Tax=uncultured Caudovirales phage TaxID=2100421 RepID=A0A2H4IYF8_9CAUD|nr:hypothetical protein 10S2_4 [uncultured Caudovirales phage]
MTIKVNYANGDNTTTRFNGTVQEATAYYVGKVFNIGIVSDNLQKCNSIEVVEGESEQTTHFKAREQEIKNSYLVKPQDEQYVIMQKDFYFSEVLNDYQEYWTLYRPYKTLKGAISALKKIVDQHFPEKYFTPDNSIDDFIKSMVQ